MDSSFSKEYLSDTERNSTTGVRNCLQRCPRPAHYRDSPSELIISLSHNFEFNSNILDFLRNFRRIFFTDDEIVDLKEFVVMTTTEFLLD